MAVQSPFTGFIREIREVVLAQKYLVAGIKIMSPNAAECLDFPMVTITGSFHTRWPKCSRKNRFVVENRRVVSLNNANGGVRSIEATGENVMKVMVMCVFWVTDVDRGPRLSPTGCNAAIYVPYASNRSFTSFIRMVLGPPARIAFSGRRISSFLWVL